MLKWKKTRISYVAGELDLLCGLFLWIATIPCIRRKSFEIFFYTHYLYILFIVFFIFHVGISYACIMLPGFYLFLVDRCLRFLQSRCQVRLLSARVLPCQTVELNFSKSHGNITLLAWVLLIAWSTCDCGFGFTIERERERERERMGWILLCEVGLIMSGEIHSTLFFSLYRISSCKDLNIMIKYQTWMQGSYLCSVVSKSNANHIFILNTTFSVFFNYQISMI